MLDLDQAVGPESRARAHQIDDAPAEPEPRCQLHGAVELDAFGLDPAGGEMAARHTGILGGDPHVTPARRIVPGREFRRLRHHHAAEADAEVERRIDLAVVELQQHVVADDAELGRAEGDEGGDVEAAHPDQPEPRVRGGEAELARAVVRERGLRLDACARQQRRKLAGNPAFGQREQQAVAHGTGSRSPAEVGRGSSRS